MWRPMWRPMSRPWCLAECVGCCLCSVVVPSGKPLRWIPFQRRYSDGMNTGMLCDTHTVSPQIVQAHSKAGMICENCSNLQEETCNSDLSVRKGADRIISSKPYRDTFTQYHVVNGVHATPGKALYDSRLLKKLDNGLFSITISIFGKML